MQRELLFASKKDYIIPPGGYLFQVTVGVYKEVKEGVSDPLPTWGFIESQNVGNISPELMCGVKIKEFSTYLLYSLLIELETSVSISEGSYAQRLDSSQEFRLVQSENSPTTWSSVEFIPGKPESTENIKLFFTDEDIGKTIPVLVVPIFA